MSSVNKVELDVLESIMRQQEFEQGDIVETMKAIKEHLEANKAEPTPRAKRKLVLVVSDPDGSLADKEIVGWVTALPETAYEAEIPRLISLAADEFNQTKKGKKLPVKNVGEALEAVPAKFFKKHGELQIKTKEPVFVVRTDNELQTVGEADRNAT